MTSTIEKVARAIFVDGYGRPEEDWDLLPEVACGECRDDFKEWARAAIRALLEPTEYMKGRAAGIHLDDFPDARIHIGRDLAECVWRTCIEAALEYDSASDEEKAEIERLAQTNIERLAQTNLDEWKRDHCPVCRKLKSQCPGWHMDGATKVYHSYGDYCD